MPHLTEEELINEVRHLHSLHRQGPPLQHPTQNPNPPIINPSFIPNRPIFNPNPHSIHPVHHVLNPNWVPQPPIFNSNPSSVYPIHPIANPGNFNNRPGFNPGPGSFYTNSDPSMPILNHDHRPNAYVHNAHIFNHGHGSIVGAMTGYDSNGYSYPGPRVSNVQPYLQSNVESVTHGNLNNKLSRLSLGVQGTKPKNMKKKGKKGGGGGGYEEVDPLIFVHDLFVVVHTEHQAFAVSDRVGLESRGCRRRLDSQITLNRDVSQASIEAVPGILMERDLDVRVEIRQRFLDERLQKIAEKIAREVLVDHGKYEHEAGEQRPKTRPHFRSHLGFFSEFLTEKSLDCGFEN